MKEKEKERRGEDDAGVAEGHVQGGRSAVGVAESVAEGSRDGGGVAVVEMYDGRCRGMVEAVAANWPAILQV